MVTLSQSAYHKIVRSAMVLCAVVLVFDSGIFISGTKALSLNTKQYLASAVGVNATVEPNEVNILTAEITRQRAELESLREREIAIELSSNQSESQNSDFSTYILSIILFILLVLVTLNYLLDYLRYTRLKQLETQS